MFELPKIYLKRGGPMLVVFYQRSLFNVSDKDISDMVVQ